MSVIETSCGNKSHLIGQSSSLEAEAFISQALTVAELEALIKKDPFSSADFAEAVRMLLKITTVTRSVNGNNEASYIDTSNSFPSEDKSTFFILQKQFNADTGVTFSTIGQSPPAERTRELRETATQPFVDRIRMIAVTRGEEELNKPKVESFVFFPPEFNIVTPYTGKRIGLSRQEENVDGKTLRSFANDTFQAAKVLHNIIS